MPVCSKREHFQAFVQRAETAGQQADGVALLDEHQLAGEEVLHVDQLGIAGDDRIGRLLEGQKDVQPHRIFAARPYVPGLHDAARGAGDDHPVMLGHLPAELDRLLVGGLMGRGPGRAEDGHLAVGAVGGEDFEGIAQFAERAAEELDVAAAGAVLGQLVGRELDFVDQFGDPFRRDLGHGRIETRKFGAGMQVIAQRRRAKGREVKIGDSTTYRCSLASDRRELARYDSSPSVIPAATPAGSRWGLAIRKGFR